MTHFSYLGVKITPSTLSIIYRAENAIKRTLKIILERKSEETGKFSRKGSAIRSDMS